MRRRLLKAIICIIVAVSVFCSNTSVSFAASSGPLEVVLRQPAIFQLDDFYYDPGYFPHTFHYRVVCPFYFSGSDVLPYIEGNFGVSTNLSFDFRVLATTSSSSCTYTVGVEDFGIMGVDSQYYDISLSNLGVYNSWTFVNQPVGTYPKTITEAFNINFFDFPVSLRAASENYWFFYYDFYLSVSNASRTHYSFSLGTARSSLIRANIYSTDSRLYSDSSPIVDAIDALAEQSKKQHEEIKDGYDNSNDNAMLEDKNQQLTDFEAIQGSAFDSANAGVADFHSSYDTTVFTNLTPSFALIAVWFNTLWSGMGSFSVVLTVSLVLCVAGYILKIKH